MDSANPWLRPQPTVAPPALLPEPESAESAGPATVAVTGPTAPQPGVLAPDQVDRLPVRPMAGMASLWIVGAHGGAGESTLAELDPYWRATGHSWPEPVPGRPTPVLVVARTSVRGIEAAKSAGKQWASGLVVGVRLLGLVLVADAPGRLPRPVRDLIKVVSGGFPRLWQLAWSEPVRLGERITPADAGRDVRRLIEDLRLLTLDGAADSKTQRKERKP